MSRRSVPKGLSDIQSRLTPADANAILEEIDTMIRETVRDGIDHASMTASGSSHSSSSLPDTADWQYIKKRKGLKFYKKKKNARRNRNDSGERAVWTDPGLPELDPKVSSDVHSMSADSEDTDRTMSYSDGVIESMKPRSTPLIAVTGRLDLSLDDFMLGNLAEDMSAKRVRHSLLYESTHECRTLAVLAKPTAEDPFRHVTLKWMVNERPSTLPGVASHRDHLCVHATGTTQDERGRDVGYNVFHTLSEKFKSRLSVPTDTNGYVRATMSFCMLGWTSECSETMVDLFVKGFFDAGGKLVEQVATHFAMDCLSSTLHLAPISMAKRVRFLDRQKRQEGKRRPDRSTGDDCVVCHRARSKFFGSSLYNCRICRQDACSKCNITMDVAMGVLSDDEATTANKLLWDVCINCVFEAKNIPVAEVVEACRF